MKHLISLKEQSRGDILEILRLAERLKKKYKAGKSTDLLPNKTLIMYFGKTSTRTRLSFEAAMTELGGHAIYLDTRTSQFTLADFRDEIRATMRFGDVLMMRTLHAGDVLTAASFNIVPIIDGCSDKYHPCQALGDILTMAEHSGGLSNVKKITWLGMENNVSNTLVLACAKLGIRVSIAAPERNAASIDPELDSLVDAAGVVSRTLDVKEALAKTDYVHTDAWMNVEFFQEGAIKPEYAAEYERRKNLLVPYQLNAELIERHAPSARIMHCMPMHVGYEITRDAIDHPNSVIFDQAENRKHIQKAILLWLLDKTI